MNLNELKKKHAEMGKEIERLERGARPVTEGWECGPGFSGAFDINRDGGFVAEINRHGMSVIGGAEHLLDGIAHDDKGRIKVVGYVCAEELKGAIRSHHTERYLREGGIMQIIDELAG